MAVSSELVARLRRMTGVSATQYTIDGVQHWTDADLAEVLDRRVSARFLQDRVDLIPTVDDTGSIAFLDGRARVPGTLDTASVRLQAFTGEPITGATIEDDGRISFPVDQAGAGPLISGLAYDLNGAAADVLTEWAAHLALGYDISTDGQSMTRSQRHAQLLEQAHAFRRQSLPGSVRVRNRERPLTLADRALQFFNQLR